MIARLWRGWARTSADGDEYVRFLRESFLPSAADLPGFNGASVMRRRLENGDTEFLTMTRFASLNAVKSFAGENYEEANVAQRARELLSHFEPRCVHYDIALCDDDLRGRR